MRVLVTSLKRGCYHVSTSSDCGNFMAGDTIEAIGNGDIIFAGMELLRADVLCGIYVDVEYMP